MAIDAQASDTNGRNVAPLSSTLHITTMDVDCSGLTHAPVDGEFLMVQGRGAAVAQASGLPTDGNGDKPAKTAPCALANEGAALLRMVWSEEGRSDTQATGRKRIPVAWMGGMHLKLGLYTYDAAALPQVGDLVYVSVTHAAVSGASAGNRLNAMIESGTDSGIEAGWAVGTVVRAVATAGDPCEIMLFPQPQLIGAV